MKNCVICGKPLPKTKHKYCCTEREVAARRIREQRPKKEYKKICKFCGKEFITNQAHQKFCCRSCCSNFHINEKRKHPEIYGENRPFSDDEIFDISEFNKINLGRSQETIPKGCLSCEYCKPLQPMSRGIRVCHYLLDTDEPRGCSTKECVENKIHFKPRPRKKKQEVFKNDRA